MSSSSSWVQPPSLSFHAEARFSSGTFENPLSTTRRRVPPVDSLERELDTGLRRVEPRAVPEEDEAGRRFHDLDRAVVELAVLPLDPDRAARPQVDLGRLVREPPSELLRLGERPPHTILGRLDHELSPDLVGDLHPTPPLILQPFSCAMICNLAVACQVGPGDRGKLHDCGAEAEDSGLGSREDARVVEEVSVDVEPLVAVGVMPAEVRR